MVTENLEIHVLVAAGGRVAWELVEVAAEVTLIPLTPEGDDYAEEFDDPSLADTVYGRKAA